MVQREMYPGTPRRLRNEEMWMLGIFLILNIGIIIEGWFGTACFVEQ